MTTAYDDFLSSLGTSEEEWTLVSRTSANRESARLLRAALRRRQLALVLGAGISFDCNIPLWRPLVSGLVARGFPKAIRAAVSGRNVSLTKKIRFLEAYRRHYRLLLRDAIYKKARVPAGSNLAYLARFVADQYSKRRLNQIITYNFDDLLREEVTRIAPSIRIKMICSGQQLAERQAGLRIVHPHGYIRRDHDDDDILKSQLVFSEPDYHRHFMDHSNWANVVQLSTFLERVCLFIGVSFEDPNQRRLLDMCNRVQGLPDTQTRQMKHVAIVRRQSNDYRNLLIQKDLESLGIIPYWVTKFTQIPYVLRAISK